MSPLALATRLILLANFAGVRDPPGSFTKSRASATPSRTATAPSTAVRALTEVEPVSITLANFESVFVDL